MAFYLFLFALPLAGLLVSRRMSINTERLAWIFLMCIWIGVIGLRDGPGCDWDTYANVYQSATEKFDQFFVLAGFPKGFHTHLFADMTNWLYKPGYYPGYTLAMIVSWVLGWGIVGVNLICAVIVVTALGLFCRKNSSPWFAWLMATPYLLIVVSMGYSRQAVAISLFALSLMYLQERKTWYFLTLVLIGATFHKSAAFFIPLAFIYSERVTFKKAIIIGLPLVLAAIWIVALLYGHYRSYLEGMWYSKGAFARIWMTTIPAGIFLLTSKQQEIHADSKLLLNLLSIVSIVLGITVGFATTPIDRIGLYFIPIQIMLWSTIVVSLRRWNSPIPISTILILLYASTLFVWLTWSINARCWQPYRSILFSSI